MVLYGIVHAHSCCCCQHAITVRPPQEADDFCLSETADYVAGTFAKALEDKVLGSLDTARLRNWRDKSKLLFF